MITAILSPDRTELLVQGRFAAVEALFDRGAWKPLHVVRTEPQDVCVYQPVPLIPPDFVGRAKLDLADKWLYFTADDAIADRRTDVSMFDRLKDLEAAGTDVLGAVEDLQAAYNALPPDIGDDLKKAGEKLLQAGEHLAKAIKG